MPPSENDLLRPQMSGIGLDPDAARREIAASRADLLKVTNPRDRANLQANIDDLTRQLNNFGASVETIDSADGIGAFLNQQVQTPQHLDSADAIGSFLGPQKADTSDPAGNMDPRDIRQTQGYINTMEDQMPPSWMARARQAMAASPVARGALELTQPGVANAVARRAVPTIVGAPGDMIDFAGNTVPGWFGAKGFKGRTGLPTSEDVSGVLDRAGWADQRVEHPVASMMGGALGAVTPMGPITDAALIRPAIRKFGAGTRMAEDAQRAVTGAADAGRARIVGENPMPGPVADPALPTPVRPVYPGPESGPPVPPAAKPPAVPARTPPTTPSSQLEAHIAENDARIAAEKQAAYEKYKAAPAPKGIDLQDFKDDLGVRIARAGTEEEANALRRVLNNVNRIESESDTQFESLDKLRRQLGKQAKFGEETSGYEAIGAQQGRELNRALGERMKAEHPAYAEYTQKYSDLSQEARPSGSAFLKQAGAEEGSADLVKNALASPKNVDQTIAAIGADGAAKLDKLAVPHVQNLLGRKTGQALEDAYTDLMPRLEKLPEARARAEALLRSRQLEESQTAIAEKLAEQYGRQAQESASRYSQLARGAEKEAKAANEAARAAHADKAEGVARDFTARKDAALQAQETARSYVPLMNNLQKAEDPARRIKALTQMKEKMWKDGLITDAQHAAFTEQIEAAAHSAKKQQQLETVSKYMAYMLTGNYMISFGGPHVYKYLTDK